MNPNTPADPELSPVKRALLELRELRARLDENEYRLHQPIAIVGAGLRFPGGVDDLDSFWKLLREGVDAIVETPADRWDNATLYDPDPAAPGKVTTRFGGFLERPYHFDAHFFGISPREAESMDPQQRLLLEVTWEALENAGISPDSLFGSQAGVFLGISNSDYYRQMLADPAKIDPYATTGNAYSVAGGRLSYTLGLHGPNISLDTACSSSLTALYLAVQSLRRGECSLALAGGVNLILTPEISINFSKAHMMAADGRCKTFDAAADGYGRGEGCAMVVLKRLEDARQDGDLILAVIRGAAINHDGRSGGLTAPNGPAQEAVLRAALEDGGLSPAEVGYVETHGTGTPLGDPIEVQALTAVLCPHRPAGRPLALGSVKTNFGHLEAAAGIAGVLKAALVLKHGQIPPHLNFRALNPHISLDGLPVTIPTTLTPWSGGGPRLAGVSSFGLSGTNAHLILEAPPAGQPPSPQEQKGERPLHLLTLSARNEQALRELAARHVHRLADDPSIRLADYTFSANTGRAPLPERAALVAGDMADLAHKLGALQQGQEEAGVMRGSVAGAPSPEVAFLFTGHGAHYVNMGRQLYESEPVFRAALERCAELLVPLLPAPLLEVLYPGQQSTGAEPASLDDMAFTQAALFSLQHALAQLWLSWGVKPAVLLGHSGGEYVAACLAGVFNLEDALKMVTVRGRLMAATATGIMAAVFADEAVVAAAIAPYAGKVSIAVYNAPGNIVISGEQAAVEAALEALKARHVKARKLAIGQAAHSPLIEPALDEFEALVASLDLHEPQIALVSSVTGQLVVPGEMAQPGYWRRHLRQPVRFSAAMQALHAQGLRLYLEIGPNPVLLTNGQRCVPAAGQAWLPSLRQGQPDVQQMLESLGGLYTRGAGVDWTAFEATPRRKVPLPTYPFQRSEYRAAVASPYRPAAAGTADVWQSATAAGERQAGRGPLDLAPQAYPARWEALHRLTVAYIARCLGQLGAFAQPGEALTPQDLLRRYGIQPVYHSLMSRWLNHLAAAGLVRAEGELFSGTAPLPDDVEAAWAAARPILADTPILAEYVERCGNALASVLTGAASPLDTLFPGGSFAQAEGLYQYWPVSRYFIDIVQAVAENVAHAQPGRPLRVLELGAGTGATTASVLPVMPAAHTTYFFTDVSDLFLDHAARKFQAFGFVRYGLLDIEKSPAAQGYPAHAFDLVIAANVLHATHNLDHTLENVKELLAPGGLLLANEATTVLSWLDITTALIGGWQLFADGWRSDNPLIPPQRWEAALRGNGFERVTFWPAPGTLTEVLGQHVLLAQLSSQETGAASGPQAAFEERAFPAAPAPAETAGKSAAAAFLEELRAAIPAERHELLTGLARRQVARVLRLKDVQLVDVSRRLLELGLDSLMALELRKALSDSLELPEKALSATLVFDYPTVETIARYLAEEVLALADGGQAQATPGKPASGEQHPAPADRQAEVAEMSDDEVAALLLKKLSASRK